MVEDFERCYRAVSARDARFDGWFVTAVTSTHIYCRPELSGPHPGTSQRPLLPELRRRATSRVPRLQTLPSRRVAGFAGVERAPGRRGPRHAHDRRGRRRPRRRGGTGAHASPTARDSSTGSCVSEVGAGPLALARAQRAQTARVLVETTELPVSSVAFAAGFASVRQFNDTIRQVFACTPTELRRTTADGPGPVTGHLEPAPGPPPPLRRARHLGVPGPSGRPRGRGRHVDDDSPGRSPSPTEAAPSSSYPDDGHVRARLRLDDLRDLTPAVQRCRHLLDLDADPVAVADHSTPTRSSGPWPAASRDSGCREPSTPTSWRCAPSSASRCRWRAPGASSAGWSPSTAAPLASRTARTWARSRRSHPSLSRHGDDRRPRPRPPSPPSPPGPHLGDHGRGAGRRSAHARRRRRRRSGAVVVAHAPGHRTLDRRLHRRAGARPPRRHAVGRPRRATRLRPLDLAPTPTAVDELARRWRPWRSYATLHLWGYRPDEQVRAS